MLTPAPNPSMPDGEPDLSAADVLDSPWQGAVGELARWVVVAAVTGMVLLAVLEAAVRVHDWIQYRTPLLSPFRSQLDFVVRDIHGAHGLPNARFKKFVLNNVGMRGPPVDPSGKSSTVRVLAVGASETFGLYESPNMEFPRQLEDSLRAGLAHNVCSNGIDSFEVLNNALVGMTMPTIAQDLRNRVAALDPDVVLYYSTPAQYLEHRVPRAALADSSVFEPRPLPWTRSLHFRLTSELRERLKGLLPERMKDWRRRQSIAAARADRPDGWLFREPPPARLQAYENDLRMLVGTIRSIGAMPVLVPHVNAFMVDWRPNDPYLLNKWVRFYPRATGATVIAFDSLARDVTWAVAADSGALFVDTTPRLNSAAQALFADYAHFNDRGAALHAGAIAAAILGEVCGEPQDLTEPAALRAGNHPVRPTQVEGPDELRPGLPRE